MRTYTAFADDRRVYTGEIEPVLRALKAHIEAGGDGARILVFEDQTGEQIDFDLRGTADEAVARLATHPWFAARPKEEAREPKPQAGPGRPRLGVVSREVSLLPRHWEWLQGQPGGASAALRRLVDDAKKRHTSRDRARSTRDAVGRFMWVMAGHLPGFEEASRALFANEYDRLRELTSAWPRDIRDHVGRLAEEAARCAREADKKARCEEKGPPFCD